MDAFFSKLMTDFERAAVELNKHYPQQHAYADIVANNIKAFDLRQAAYARAAAKMQQQEI